MSETVEKLAVKERALEAIPQQWKDSAKVFHGSNLFKRDGKAMSAYEILTKTAFGAAFGLTAAESQWAMHVVPGKPPSLSAQFIAARIKASDRYDYEILEWNDEVCVLDFFERSKRDGSWREVGISSFSMHDARRANLLKKASPWQTYPASMLFNRALTRGARAYCPDLLYGNPMYSFEELLPPDDPAIIQEAEWAESQPEPKGGLLIHDLEITDADLHIKAGISDIERVKDVVEHVGISWDDLGMRMHTEYGIDYGPAEWTVADVKRAFVLMVFDEITTYE